MKYIFTLFFTGLILIFSSCMGHSPKYKAGDCAGLMINGKVVKSWIIRIEAVIDTGYVIVGINDETGKPFKFETPAVVNFKFVDSPEVKWGYFKTNCPD